jgi:glycosyltransferase involved in cell wall biosynthesis
MAFGCPVLASTAGAVRETCGDAALYFAPDDVGSLAALMSAQLKLGKPSPAAQDRQRRHAARFTWQASARRLLETIATL